ncbi:MAG: hypothetical protein ABI675_02710 [Chitinophagaceae bacterium]
MPKNLNDKIVYVLPPPIDSLLKPELAKRDKSVYLALSQEDSGIYIIYVSTQIRNNPLVSKSNRSLFIDGKFYPLSLDIDMVLGTTSTAHEILDEYRREKYVTIKKRFTINEGYFIPFKTDGQIVRNGHGLSEGIIH